MNQKQDIGVYFIVDEKTEVSLPLIKHLEKIAMSLPGVAVTWNSIAHPHCADCITSTIVKYEIEKIVVVGNHPGILKPYFGHIMANLGYSGESVKLASFVEHGIETENYEIAAEFISKIISGDQFEFQQSWNGHSVVPETIVIGGGIAGIQASLEIANAGKKVFLIEKQGTIGGHMAMFDKTFPTLDCAACILTPKMVEVSQNPFIELLTYSEVTEVKGAPGNFKVKVLKKARFVSEELCIGCGSCSAKCPAKAPSEFDVGTALRKAIYMPFPQAVPNKYLIDKDSCNYIQSDGKKCGVCVKFCPVNDCIDLHQKDEVIELNVGNIVVATGFKPFDASRIERYGYGKHMNVITSLELERLINAGGPTEGKITLRSEDKKGNWIFKKESPSPKNVAIIHCVGSRDENYHKYCSRVCCMYSLKLAHLIKEKLPESEVFEYFIDMRAFGKGYEEFYQRIVEEGVHIIRGKTATIDQDGEQLSLRTEDILNNRIIEQKVDMAVLAIGLEAASDADYIAKMLNIKQSCEGWFTEANSLIDPIATINPAITIAGVCQGPKDIPDTVAHASAAAAKVLKSIESNTKVTVV